MNHSDHLVEGELHGYLDDELSTDQRAAVERHLDECEVCRAELERLQALFLRLETTDESALSRDLAAPVMRELRAAEDVAAGLRWLSALEVVVAGVLFGLVVYVGAEGEWLAIPTPPLGEAGALLSALELAMRSEVVAHWSEAETWLREGLSLLTSMSLPQAVSRIQWLPALAALLVLWLSGNGVLLSQEWGGAGRLPRGRASNNGADHG